MNKYNNCVAVVTGAGSGIGRALALQLNEAGAHLAVSDINFENLQETVAMLNQGAGGVFSSVLDVANQTAVFDHAQEVMNHYGRVNLVINNAGVALASGNFWETPLDDFKWLMDINFYGVVFGTKAFLPLLQQSDWGHIVNISSLFGLVSVPEQSAYNSSKFAVRGLTEALRQELELADSNVSCTSVHPGGIKTNIARAAKVSQGHRFNDETEKDTAANDFDKLARTTPESAAQQILEAVQKNKKRLLIGTDAKLLDKIQRLLPTRYGNIMQSLVERMRK